ncbi:MAG: S-layer homology domain-containing protein [Evtepia sp.]
MLPSINNVQTLPDVTGSTKYSQEIFSLYNAGVLTGSDVFGTFKPNDNIIRAEAAAILTRVALPGSARPWCSWKQVQWGNAKIAVPQSAGAGVTENGYFSVSSQQDLCVAVANAATDKNFKGYNITKLFTPDSMSQIDCDSSFRRTTFNFKNMGAETVTFGALKAYRTTGSALFNEGNYNCVVYTYISGDTMSMILLMAYENDIALQNMANGLMVSGVTALPNSE